MRQFHIVAITEASTCKSLILNGVQLISPLYERYLRTHSCEICECCCYHVALSSHCVGDNRRLKVASNWLMARYTCVLWCFWSGKPIDNAIWYTKGRTFVGIMSRIMVDATASSIFDALTRAFVWIQTRSSLRYVRNYADNQPAIVQGRSYSGCNSVNLAGTFIERIVLPILLIQIIPRSPGSRVMH